MERSALNFPLSRLKQPTLSQSRQLSLFLKAPTADGLQYAHILQTAGGREWTAPAKSQLPPPRSI
jgi:hypothetical protein